MKLPRNTNRKSQWVLRAILLAVVLAYLAFYLIGFNLPYLFNPEQNAPLLTGLVVGLALLLIGLTLAAVVWSRIREHLHRQRPAGLLGRQLLRRRNAVRWAVALTLTALMILAFSLAGAQPVSISNEPFAEQLPLRLAAMFIITTAVMLLLALAALLYSRLKRNR